MKKSARGFTLVEIMIVVAIIGLLASIAIPTLIRMRMNANESTIKQDLRGFGAACEIFRSSQNPLRFPNDVTELASAVPSYIDSTWMNNPRHQYSFSYAVGGVGTTYSMLAAPTPSGGFNTYCIDQTGIIVASVNGVGAPAGAAAGCSGGVALQ